MTKSLLLDPVQILYGPKNKLSTDAVFITDNKIVGFGQDARTAANEVDIPPTQSDHQIFAPCLVDPHSFLERPFNGKSENLSTLRERAALGGYGQIALLPRGPLWRDQPELLQGYNNTEKEVSIHLWGSFSKSGHGKDLSPHGELIKHGAIGLAEDDSIPPPELIKRGFVLAEMGKAPIILAPKDKKIQGDGIVREGVAALRAGWLPDPIASETVPLCLLLELKKQHPELTVRLMNISTAAGLSILSKAEIKPMASVSWWHLIKDTSLLEPDSIGWRVSPSLGNPDDREALILGLCKGTINAVAVNAIALEKEEMKQPTAEQPPGISGYHLVLPMLWQELVVRRNWEPEELWKVLSFNPSKMINRSEEKLVIGSNRWLLFDPNKKWDQTNYEKLFKDCGNIPMGGEEIIGKVIDCGLKGEGGQIG